MRGWASRCLTPGVYVSGALAWLTVVLCFDPDHLIRRLALTSLSLGGPGAMIALPKSQDELYVRWFSIPPGALVLWADPVDLGNIGLAAENLSMGHLANRPQEPSLRGEPCVVFVRSQECGGGPFMAMLLFLGIYIVRAGRVDLSGAVIHRDSLSLFLLHSDGQ